MERILKRFKGQKIALYGLSNETKKFIDKYGNTVEIVGLLDGFREKGKLFEYEILSIEKVIKKEIKLIIVIARPGSCKAIACQIGDACIKNNIKLYDVRGVDLLQQKKHILEINKLIDIVKQSNVKNTYSDNVKFELFQEKINTLDLENEKCVISNAYDIGYLFFAPLITDFVLWLHNQISVQSIKNIWFSARDGFLIKRLFEVMDGELSSIYFLTSRCAAIRAGISDVEDIKYVESMQFSGKLSENLKVRFGMDIDVPDDAASLMDFKDEIFEKVKESKGGYQKYLEKLCIQSGDIALFDFVAKGTTQYFIEKLLSNHLIGFYFLQLEPEFMEDKNLDIISFYSRDEFEKSVIYDDYYILETILTSSESSVIDFDAYGNPIYVNETRSKSDILCLKKVQEGIFDYFKAYLFKSKEHQRVINKCYDEIFLKMIHNVEISDVEFMKLEVEDPFFNRVTKIKDIL